MQLSALRSLLFLPATAEHLLARAAQRGADALVIDLEDAVPPARKQEARGLATLAVAALSGRAPLLLRVNAEPALLAQDIASAPLAQIDAVMLPKVESAQQVQALVAMLAQSGHATPVVALIETALGVVQAASIAQAGPGLAALGFGAEDYAAEMGVAPQPRSLLWPAQQVATCARAWQLPCWGLPGSVAEIDDMAAFSDLVAQARAVGFTGTVCIHPRQVGVANAGFGPTADELAWAARVVAADHEAAARGLGAVVLDGRMVDRPVVERARRWLLARQQAPRIQGGR